jgi:hypothetical protein
VHHGLLERHLLDLDAMAQQGHQRDPRVNVGGLHEWRLGETGVVGDRDAAEIGNHTPSEARMDVLDVDLAADRVARLGQDEAALLLDDPVEVEHGVDHHRGHDRNDDANHDDGCSDKLAHHDTPSRSDETSFSAEAGGYDNAAAPSEYPPAMTFNLLPILPVYSVTDSAGLYPLTSFLCLGGGLGWGSIGGSEFL